MSFRLTGEIYTHTIQAVYRFLASLEMTFLIVILTIPINPAAVALNHIQRLLGFSGGPFAVGFFDGLCKRINRLCAGYAVFHIHHKKRNPAYAQLLCLGYILIYVDSVFISF